jgi:negative regulator of sigma-B (phosphoserine phosphatase)
MIPGSPGAMTTKVFHNLDFELYEPSDNAQVVYATRKLAAQLGFDESEQFLIATAVSELATNIIRYANQGRITLRRIQEDYRTGIEVTAEDYGPGIVNIDEAMQEHFSSGSGLGLGLPSVRRIMDEFAIESKPGQGTRVVVRKWRGDRPAEVDYYLVKRGLTGWEDECGDTGMVREIGDRCFLALFDALGHGKEAYETALLAEHYVSENIDRDLVDVMQGLHIHLKGTRGVVAAFCLLNQCTGNLRYVGVGNITTKIYGAQPYHFVPQDGIVGYMMASPKEQQRRLHHGDILMLSSDGIREHFDIYDFPDLLSGSARQIATAVMDSLGKGNDDASCLVLRYGK